MVAVLVFSTRREELSESGGPTVGSEEVGGSARVPLSPPSYSFLDESWNLDVEKRPGAKIEMTREVGWLNTPGFA